MNRRLLLGLTTSALVTVAATFAACAESGAGHESTGGSGGSGAATSTGGGTTSTTSGSGGDDFDAGLNDAEPLPPPKLYAHTADTLYQADPEVTPLALVEVGKCDCLGGAGQSASMTDLAVDADGNLVAISTKNFYKLQIQGSTVHCATVTPLNNPTGIQFYGLTFAPKGVLAPDEEVLVAGNTAGELWAIDAQGNLEQHGTLGVVPADDGHGHTYDNAGQIWELSGDILFVANDGNPIGFATVRDCPTPPSPAGCNPVDTLIELDIGALAAATTQPVVKTVRGQIVKRTGCNDGVTGDYGNLYGIAAWKSSVFGFSRLPQNAGGFAVDVSIADGTACAIDTALDVAWYGAGISTLAKVDEPPN